MNAKKFERVFAGTTNSLPVKLLDVEVDEDFITYVYTFDLVNYKKLKTEYKEGEKIPEHCFESIIECQQALDIDEISDCIYNSVGRDFKKYIKFLKSAIQEGC